MHCTIHNQAIIFYFCNQVLQELGFGLTRQIVGEVVCDYLKDKDRPNPFPDQHPGRDWWEGFMKRWAKQLTERKPQHLSVQRALAANRATIAGWFDAVATFFDSIKLIKRGRTISSYAQRIWNCDESGFCLAAASDKVLAKRGARSVHETTGGSDRSYITVLACGSSSGCPLPPFTVYKGVYVKKDWLAQGLAGAHYGVSESGWMEGSNFLSWFNKLFVPAVSHLLKTGPVVLFVDGHHSHITLDLIQSARDKGVHLYCLPPNCTHILQPLDVGTFGPMKSEWKKILQEYRLQTKAAKVEKRCFAELLAKLWQRAFTPEHVQAGFRGSGLYPFDPSAIHDEKLSPSLPLLPPLEDHPDDSTTPQRPAQKVQSTTSTAQTVPFTPLKVYLRDHFAAVLQHGKPSRQRQKGQVKPRQYGEVLTADEVYERIEEEYKKRDKPVRKKCTRAKKGKQKGQDKYTEEESDDNGMYLYYYFLKLPYSLSHIRATYL